MIRKVNVEQFLSWLRYSAAGALVGSAIIGAFFNQAVFLVGGLDLKSLGAIVGALFFLAISIKLDLK